MVFFHKAIPIQLFFAESRPLGGPRILNELQMGGRAIEATGLLVSNRQVGRDHEIAALPRTRRGQYPDRLVILMQPDEIFTEVESLFQRDAAAPHLRLQLVSSCKVSLSRGRRVQALPRLALRLRNAYLNQVYQHLAELREGKSSHR